jgi:hypothetical protein
VWQIVYEFDRPRARDALEHLRRRYGEPYGRLWERHDELYLTWLAFQARRRVRVVSEERGG